MFLPPEPAQVPAPSQGREIEWTPPVSVRAYGVRFQVRSNDAALLSALEARLPPGARMCQQKNGESFACSAIREVSGTTAESATAWQVFLDAEWQTTSHSEREALDAFEGLVRFEVARRAPRWTFVHAGVVGWRGRAILIPGKSFSGKSTLVQALVGAGAEYYSDEYAVLDRHGRVFPFAQPLMNRAASGVRERLSIAELGGTLGTRPLPVGLVVATHYTPGATWNPAQSSTGEALLALLSNTVRAQAEPSRVMRVLAKVAETATTVEGARGEAQSTAAELLQHVAEWQTSDPRSIA